LIQNKVIDGDGGDSHLSDCTRNAGDSRWR
jgi:hypothetical protein